MNTFTKKERLNSKKNIQLLFEKGTTFFSHPFKVYFSVLEAEDTLSGASILFSVGKRQFKQAVDRNRVKRLCRETYRLNKGFLIETLKQENRYLEIALVYVSKTIPDFAELQINMQKILARLANSKKK